MTYKDNFVVEVKCNGKIMRIKDDAVYLPYGSEYSLLLKNLNSRKASIKIHIDGEDVLDYSSLILQPNSTTELEGFLRGSIATNRFKFIQKTKQIQDHRGDKVDDGLIRVEFAFEKEKPEVIKKTIIHDHHHHDHHHYDHYHWNYGSWFTGNSFDKYGSSLGQDVQGSYTCNNDIKEGITAENCSSRGIPNINFVQIDTLGIEPQSIPLVDEGITVKGSECNQHFNYGSIGELEQSKVIIIQLKGLTGNGIEIQQPITVKTKLECPTCGLKSKSSFKFCPNCGTFLE